MNIDRVGADGISLVLPDLECYGTPGDDGGRALQEDLEDAKLYLRKVDRCPARSDNSSCRLVYEVPCQQARRARFCGPALQGS